MTTKIHDGRITMPPTLDISGVMLRDWFAGMALQGCLAYSRYNEAWGDFHNNGSNGD